MKPNPFPFSTRALITLLPALLFLLVMGFRPAETPAPRTLAKGTFSGIRDAGQEVIKDKAAWTALWARVNTGGDKDAKLPEVDFSKEMVVAVFMGEKNTGGYGIEIQKVEPAQGRLKIKVKRHSPAPDTMTIQAITSPFHIVAVPRSDLKPEFTE